jgi:hypothetical protein
MMFDDDRRARRFDLGTVLTVATGKFLSPGGWQAVYELCDHVFGRTLFTHEARHGLCLARRELLRQHPWLRLVDARAVNGRNAGAWLDRQTKTYGGYVEVEGAKRGEGVTHGG